MPKKENDLHRVRKTAQGRHESQGSKEARKDRKGRSAKEIKGKRSEAEL